MELVGGLAKVICWHETAVTRQVGISKFCTTRAYLSAIRWALGGVAAGQRRTSPAVSRTALAVEAAAVATVAREHDVISGARSNQVEGSGRCLQK